MAIDLEQTHFRFRTDGDAADATPTWGDNEDANYDPGASPFRLRMGLANLGDASSGSLALYLQKNAGSYAAITTSSTEGVKSYDASFDADDTPIRIPRLSMSAEWRLAGAAIDLDFAGNRIYPSGAFSDYLSCSRASVGYAKNADGTLTQFTSNALRITDLGLLLEGSRTNSFARSQDLVGDFGWNNFNCETPANNFTAPDGTSTAWKMVATTLATGHFFRQQLIESGTTTYAFSYFAKAAEYNYALLGVSINDGAARYSILVNLTTGAIVDTYTLGTPTVISSGAELYGDGWIRLILVITIIAGNFYTYCGGAPTSSLGSDQVPSYAGDASSGVYWWGAQCEVGSFVSSYIPTTTSSATRAADVITNSSDLQTDIAAATASVVAQVNNGKVASVAANVVDSNGTNLLGFDASNHGLASITATLATSNTANRTTQDKLGIAWDGSGRSLVLNGGTAATDATAQTPSSTQHIGSSGTDNFAFAYVERLTVWTSKLADGSLQGFTS